MARAGRRGCGPGWRRRAVAERIAATRRPRAPRGRERRHGGRSRTSRSPARGADARRSRRAPVRRSMTWMRSLASIESWLEGTAVRRSSGCHVGEEQFPARPAVAVDHGAGIGVKPVSRRRCRAPAGLPDNDRVRLAGQNALHCNAELRPVAVVARLIIILQYIDKLVGVVPSGPLDARPLDRSGVVLRAGPLAETGDADASECALVCGRAASPLCCALS